MLFSGFELVHAKVPPGLPLLVYLNFATAYPDSKSVKVYRRFAVGTGI